MMRISLQHLINVSHNLKYHPIAARSTSGLDLKLNVSFKYEPIMFPRMRRRTTVQSLITVATALLLIVGTARLLLDNFTLKSNDRQIFQFYSEPEVYRQRRPVFASSKDQIGESCNVSGGKWIWDNKTYPVYTEESCPYLSNQTSCQRNGRADSFYQKWRWQLDGCNLPWFDPLKLLDILSGKRLMFIGDSIQRGQFESMVCMVQSVIPEGKKSFQTIPPMEIFKAEEYNASIEFYWAPFIVESISDHATNHTVLKGLVYLDSITNHGKSWQGVDMLVFESYAWWMYGPTIKAIHGSSDDIKEYNVTTAYRWALEPWANWLESNINPLTQKVYFMSLSPKHLWSWEWKPGSNENCFNESYPIQGSYWGTGSSFTIMKIIQDILQELKIDVTFLNITQMSEYRKDAHTSVYGERRGILLTKEQRADPKKFADCMHWCLPGVPDTWNEILYAHLLQNHRNFL